MSSRVLMRGASSPWGRRLPSGIVPTHTPYVLDMSNNVLVDPRDVASLQRYGFETIGSAGNLLGSSTWASTGSAGGPVLVRADLSADELNHLNSSPPTLVASPGPGFQLVPTRVAIVFKAGTIPIGYAGLEGNGAGVHYEGLESPPLPVCEDQAIFVSSVAKTVTACVENVTAEGLLDNRALLLSHLHFDFADFGAITSFEIGAGGSGYAGGDTGTITSSDGNTTATYTVVSEGEGGVTELEISDPSFGYRAESGLATTATSGEGTGLELDITEITPGNGTASVYIYCGVIDVG